MPTPFRFPPAMTEPRHPIPAFLNPHSGSAREAREALEKAGGFAVTEVEPALLEGAVRRAVRAGAARVVVAGGDGSLATAARALLDTRVELGVIPAGTLNHFARFQGLPTDLAEAARVAAGARTRCADIATVNGWPILGTSSVGAYIAFVREREARERWLGYYLASFVAAVRVLGSLRRFRVELEVEGQRRTYLAPLLFTGVGEREMRFPILGGRIENGRRGLHVIVVRGSSVRSLLAVSLAAMARGLRAASHGPEMDVMLVDRMRVVLRRRGPVSIDGEIVTLDTPLEYVYLRDALRVAVPDDAPPLEPTAAS